MKCIKCGNELSPNDKFCKKCGEKVFRSAHEDVKPIKNSTSTINTEPKLNMQTPQNNKGLIIMVILLVAFVLCFLIFATRGFSLAGKWTDIDGREIEVDFSGQNSVEIHMKDFEVVTLNWKKEEANKYHITGTVPLYFYAPSYYYDDYEYTYRGMEIDTYAYYDKSDKTLSLELANEVYVLQKVR